MVYVADRAAGALLGFDASASGNVAPSVVIEGSNTTLANPTSLAFNGVNLYAANDSSNSEAIFGTYQNGNEAPLDRLTSTNPLKSEGIAFDSNHEAYISSYSTNEIDIFGQNADGTTTPIATIAGSSTNLNSPENMAIDQSGTLYVINAFPGQGQSPIEIFANAATNSGNVAPSGYLGGSNTLLSQPYALAIDSQGRLLVADQSSQILTFAKGASGNVAPVAVISGSATDLSKPSGIAVDGSDNIWVSDFGNPLQILEFAAGSSGNIAPIDQITGSNTMFEEPLDIVFIPSNEIGLVSKARRAIFGPRSMRR